MPRIVHFDVPADDPARARGFYEKAFGWKFTRWEGPMEYWLAQTGPDDEPGINGGLSLRTRTNPNVVNTISVDSIDEYLDKVKEAGGVPVLSKTALPGVGWLAYFQDTEHNVFGLMQEDPNAR